MICQERGEVLYHGFQTIRNRTDKSTRSAYGLVLSSVIRNYGVTRFLWYNLFFLIYKNVVFSGQAEYSYFSADFSLKIFLYYSWIIKNLSYPFSGLFIFFPVYYRYVFHVPSIELSLALKIITLFEIPASGLFSNILKILHISDSIFL